MNLIGIRCASFIPKKIVHSDWSLISESWVKISKVNLGIFQIFGIPWFPLEYYSLLHLFIRVWDTIPWVYNDTYRSRAQFYHYGVDTSTWFYLWDLLLLKPIQGVIVILFQEIIHAFVYMDDLVIISNIAFKNYMYILYVVILFLSSRIKVNAV